MVDFEKAFDNVAWLFIKKSLIKFNFVVVLYNGYQLFIVTLSRMCQFSDSILNGSMSKEVRDRVIPCYHICFWYVLKSCPLWFAKVTPFRALKSPMKIFIFLSQFADGTTFFLDGMRECFVHVYAYYNTLLQCLVFSWTMTNPLQFG